MVEKGPDFPKRFLWWKEVSDFCSKKSRAGKEEFPASLGSSFKSERSLIM